MAKVFIYLSNLTFQISFFIKILKLQSL